MPSASPITRSTGGGLKLTAQLYPLRDGETRAATLELNDGGYFMPVEYVKAVERAQTWHLPDPVDPAPIERGIGVYFTALDWGGISFAILEDRKFKTGPNGPLQLTPKFAPRPDWVTNADYGPK